MMVAVGRYSGSSCQSGSGRTRAHWLLAAWLLVSGCPAPISGDAGIDADADAAVVDVVSPEAITLDVPDVGLLDPAMVPKFVQPLFVLPAMPAEPTDGGVTSYHVAARQFRQQILPPPFAPSTVWGYGHAGDPLPGAGASTFHAPGNTIETRSNQTVRVTWTNGLVDDAGHYLRHLFAIDPTLHWANPGNSTAAYTGPVPLVTHLHGGHTFDTSDGNPDAWYLPAAIDVPAGFATRGTFYHSVIDVGAGAALYEYPNDQRGATLWYHDHAMGITRLNVYAGLAGFWLIRDAAEDALNLPGPAPGANDPPGTAYYEIAMAIQDKRFLPDGSIEYPSSRAEGDGFPGPYAPDGEVPPIWNTEVFGNVMIVNGVAWPYLEVEPRLYRFRFLNACSARTVILAFDRAGLSFVQIGSDGGLLPDAPVTRDRVVLGPAERADVLVDFSALHAGDSVTLLNLGPDEPYRGPRTSEPQSPADPTSTGLVMQFRLVARTSRGHAGAIPTSLPSIAPLTTTLAPRDVLLTEQESNTVPALPVHGLLATVAHGPLYFDNAPTEVVHLGDTEIWRIANLTEDAHPIHLHLVRFRVLDRTSFDAEDFGEVLNDFWQGLGAQPSLDDYIDGMANPPEAGESGWKDTVIAPPGEVTRIEAQFDRAGSYLWHCHILEHEDNAMMRPLIVMP